MEPLAYRLRPKTFDQIVGQDHLVGRNGILRKMIDGDSLTSIILYGAPGCGKTTIANVISSYYPLNHYFFNASVDPKQKLIEIKEATKFYEHTLLVIDEMHRMKKDIQDYLLPFMESGAFIVIGLTTSNPYHAINPAIRSRCHIFMVNPLKKEDMYKMVDMALNSELLTNKITLDKVVYDYLVQSANGEVRTLINLVEVLSIAYEGNVSLDDALKVIQKPALALDKDGDNYYNTISAFQKSIRGSDVNASLHYLARLLTAGDLDIICRRLIVIAYEDIGLANPSMGPKIMAAVEAVNTVGLPEARIILGTIVVDMALSPKSNSGCLAIFSALEDFKNGGVTSIPNHLQNGLIEHGKATYLYPHDYPHSFVKQQYLPDEIKNASYYIPKDTSSYEKALMERYEILKKMNK